MVVSLSEVKQQMRRKDLLVIGESEDLTKTPGKEKG